MIVLIGGFPRSGTRFYADTLNQVSTVDIRGEVHRATIPLLANWLQLNDKSHRDLGLKNEYVRHRWLIGLNAIVGTGRGSNSPFTLDNILNDVVGFKCPVIEIRLKHLQKIFKPRFNPFGPGQKIPFLFCCRRLDQVFLSRSNMTAKKRGVQLDLASFLEETKEQLRSVEAMYDSMVFKPQILNLDEFSASDSKIEWLKLRVFEKLGLSDKQISSLSEDLLLNRNSTENVFRSNRRDYLQEGELAGFRADCEFVKLCKEFEIRCGHDLVPFI